MMEKQTWTTTVEEDPNDPEECIITFPEDMMAQLGWEEGDELEWIETETHEYILHNITKDGRNK